jgi:hypothetical protein
MLDGVGEDEQGKLRLTASLRAWQWGELTLRADAVNEGCTTGLRSTLSVRLSLEPRLFESFALFLPISVSRRRERLLQPWPLSCAPAGSLSLRLV